MLVWGRAGLAELAGLAGLTELAGLAGLTELAGLGLDCLGWLGWGWTG